jgi:toxin ParE1/3/4
MANFRLSNTAKEDLIRFHQYGVKKFGIRQADKYFNDFFESFELIVNQPYSFESVNYIKEGYRRCVSGSDSIYYRIENETVEIMTIVGRQELTVIFNYTVGNKK